MSQTTDGNNVVPTIQVNNVMPKIKENNFIANNQGSKHHVNKRG